MVTYLVTFAYWSNLESSQPTVIIGGDEGNRTPDLRVANAALSQAELHPH